jgi:hypothetical protein
MSEELSVLGDVASKLSHGKISYMVTGSIAANFYSQPRMTRDLDIVIELVPSQAKQVYDLFKEEYYCDPNTISDAIQRKGMFYLIHNDSVYKVDLIVRKKSSYSDLAFQRKRKVKVDDWEFFISSPEDLVISKLLWARDSFSEVQIRDVRNLLEFVEDLDHPYIEKWGQFLDLKEIYSKVLL